MFDTSFLDRENNNEEEVDADDLSVVSKNVVDEAKKNAEEAEALAEEMKRQLEESLSQYSTTTPSPSIEDEEKKKELPPSSSSVTTQSRESYSKNMNIGIEMASNIGLSESASTSSMASLSSSKRSRPAFRQRRPSTLSWTGSEDAATANGFVRRLPITQRQQEILETIVIPAVFLLVAVAICRTFFHSWLKIGNGHSTAWALTWTVLCIVAVLAPVCVLEYLLLGGFLAGTFVQKALAKYPEVKRFLRDFRRLRLKAGWWYPSEVRTLRRDLEATNAELLSQQQSRNNQNEDERSIRRQMSREEHRKEKAQLEKIFDVERSQWVGLKEDLIAEVAAQKDKNTKLQIKLETEQQKQEQLAAMKDQIENNIQVERTQWKFSRVSLEEALKSAIAAQKDSAITRDFFDKMKAAHEEERVLWEKEREGFESTIKQAEEDALKLAQEHDGKIRLMDDMRAVKQSEWEKERKLLQRAIKKANDDAKEVKEALDSQICKLMDDSDDNFEKEIESITEEFINQKEELEQRLEDAKAEQEVSLQCVQNLQSVLDQERNEWNLERETLAEKTRSAKLKNAETEQKLDQRERVFQEERNTWETARTTFEEVLQAANKANEKSEMSTDSKKSIDAAEDEVRRVKKALKDELRLKASKIKALEESIAQFENIIAIQDRVELSTKASTEKQSNTRHRRRQRAANREANDALTPIAYIVPYDESNVKVQSSISSSSSVRSSRSIELSSSKDNSIAEACSEDSSSYYSWVQKIQETHSREQKELLKGMLTQHVRWQKANHHVGQLLTSSQTMLEASSFASDDSEGAENFHSSILTYTAASMSAKVYMEQLVTRTGHEDLLEVLPVPSLAASSFDSHSFTATRSEDDQANESSQRSNRSVTVPSNPWLKNAPLWQQVWSSFRMARMSPFQLCSTTFRTACTGIVVGTLGIACSGKADQLGYSVNRIYAKVPGIIERSMRKGKGF